MTASGTSRSAAQAQRKEHLLNRSGNGSGGVHALTSSFRELVALWLADLERQDLVESTKENFRDDLRLHVTPTFEHFTLGEITTGRVE